MHSCNSVSVIEIEEEMIFPILLSRSDTADTRREIDEPKAKELNGAFKFKKLYNYLLQFSVRSILSAKILQA